MAQTYNKLKIDIKEPVTDIITAKQNDSGSRFLDVYLYDGGVPIDLTGHELRIYMLKPDGTEIFNNGTITEAASGRCQFELTDQALGAYGKLQCEITLWKNNVQILTTPTFDIFVVKSLRTNGSIESSNEYGALVVLYQNLYEAIDLMTTMVEQFGEPGEVADAADIETFWQMLEHLYNVNADALENASVQGVIDLIGATGNTGGSATAGTLMAKANAVIGYLLNNTYGLEAIKAKVDSAADKYYAPSSTVLMNLGFTTTKCEASTTSTSSSDYARTLMKASDNFIPKGNGVVNVSGTMNTDWTYSGDVSYTAYAYSMLTVISIGSFASTSTVTESNGKIRTAITAASKAKGTNIEKNLDSSDSQYVPYSYQSRLAFTKTFNSGQVSASGNANTTFSVDVPVEKGYPVFVLLETYVRGSNSAGKVTKTTCVLTDLKIKGELKEF